MPNFNANSQQNLTAAQITPVYRNGTLIGTRRGLNFVPSTNVTLTAADNSASDRVDVTISASGGGGSGSTNFADPTWVSAPAIGITPPFGADINTALQTYGYLHLRASNSSGSSHSAYQYPNVTSGGGYYQNSHADKTIFVPRYGGLKGTNSYIAAPTFTTNVWTPVVGWKPHTQSDDDGDYGISGNTDSAGMWIQGINVDGQRNTSPTTNNRAIGFSLLGYNPITSAYNLTHSSYVLEKCSASNCQVGFWFGTPQYAHSNDLVAGNSAIGFLHQTDAIWGGGVDQPAPSHSEHKAMGGLDVGHAFIVGGAPSPYNNASYPFFSYQVEGLTVKGITGRNGPQTGIVLAYDPLANPGVMDWAEVQIQGGGTNEYTMSGTGGENDTQTITFPRIVHPDLYSTLGTYADNFTLTFPKVECWIQKQMRLTIEGYAFQSAVAGQGISTILAGPDAVLRVKNGTTWGEQTRMCVLAQDKDARVEFLDPYEMMGGIWNNVSRFPDMILGERTSYANVFAGYGLRTPLTADRRWRNALNSTSWATTASRLTPTFSASNAAITILSAQNDPETGEASTWGACRFSSSATPAHNIYTPFLVGGSSASSHSSNNTHCTLIDLYNPHATQELRLAVYLTNSGDSYFMGCDPATATTDNGYGVFVPQFVSIWPQRRMTVRIYWRGSTDARLRIAKVSPGSTQMDLYYHMLTHVTYPFYQKDVLGDVLSKGVFL